jgi:hypothetical protein
VFLPDGFEEPLLGGDVTDGLVKVGDTVRRPIQPGSAGAEAVLKHLERVGFDGAPKVLGTDAQGRRALSFLSGEVAGRPWPAWMADNDRIVSVARLVRRFDDAMQSFGLPDIVTSSLLADPPGTPPSVAGPPTFIGHMDLTPENVVFVDGQAAALIDFDMVRPTDRVGEMCNLLLWWAPLMPADDRQVAVRDVDAFERSAILVDAYGLDIEDRALIVPLAINMADRTWHTMRNRAEVLGGGWQRMWDDGAGDRILRRQTWLADNADGLQGAIRRPSSQ